MFSGRPGRQPSPFHPRAAPWPCALSFLGSWHLQGLTRLSRINRRDGCLLQELKPRKSWVSARFPRCQCQVLSSHFDLSFARGSEFLDFSRTPQPEGSESLGSTPFDSFVPQSILLRGMTCCCVRFGKRCQADAKYLEVKTRGGGSSRSPNPSLPGCLLPKPTTCRLSPRKKFFPHTNSLHSKANPLQSTSKLSLLDLVLARENVRRDVEVLSTHLRLTERHSVQHCCSIGRVQSLTTQLLQSLDHLRDHGCRRNGD